MTLQGLSIANFLGFREEVTLRFDTSRGLTTIEGENGAGKSSIVDAILWCFYGKTLRGYKGEQVVHRFTGKNCVVRQSFLDNAGRPCEVVRSRKSKQHGTGVRLLRSGKDVTPRRADEAQRAIDHAVGMNYDAFISAVVFKAGDAFSFCKLRPAEKAAVLDQVLGLTGYARAEVLARRKATACVDAAADAERAVHLAQQRVKDAKLEIARLRKEQADAARKATQMRRKLLREKRDLSRKIRALRAADAAVVKAKRKAKVLEVEARREHTELVRQRDKLVTEIAQSQAEHRAAKLTYDAHAAGKCSTCQSELTSPTKHRAAYNALVTAGNTLTVQEGALGFAQARIDKQTQRIETLIQKTRKLAVKMATQEAQLHGLEAQRRRVVQELQSNAKTTDSNAKALRSARKRHATQTHAVKTHTATVRQMRRDVKNWTFWAEGYSARGGIRSNIIAGAVPFLNQTVAAASLALTGGAVKVRFETTRKLKSGEESDVINVSVVNEDGAVDYAGCSDGEKSRVDLCVGAALSAYALRSNRSNVVFFDEPFDHMSAQNVDKSLLYLLEASKHASVYLITHNGELKHAVSGVNRVWTVTKRDRQAIVQES